MRATTQITPISNNQRKENLNCAPSRSVTTGHILVELFDGANTRHVSELLVHVVCAAARVVANPDAKVLQHCSFLFNNLNEQKITGNFHQKSHRFSYDKPKCKNNTAFCFTNLINTQNLAIGSLDVSLHLDKVPETTLGNDFVRSKNSHAIDFRIGIGGRRRVTTNYVIFAKTLRTHASTKKIAAHVTVG
jgi:hypothetical protein